MLVVVGVNIYVHARRFTTESHTSFMEAAIMEAAINSLVCAATRGDAAAQTTLAMMNYNGMGEGVPQDFAEARRLFGLAAAQGQAEAQMTLGSMHYHGHGGAIDFAEARRLLGLAAAQNLPDAQCELASMHCLGQGGSKDLTEARRLYEPAAAQGHASAQSALGTMHYLGHGGPTDFSEAGRLLGLAAAQGNADAQEMLGAMHLDGKVGPKDLAEARRLFGLAAAQGNAEAQAYIGSIHYDGVGVPQDFVEARRVLGLAAAQGHAEAQTSLGKMLAHGEGGPKDIIGARRLFGLAAEQGHAQAQVQLGSMHILGEGGPQNFAEARRLFKLSAAKGNEEAQRSLDALEGAQEAFELAAEQGQADAQLDLMHAISQGSPQDLAEAIRRFKLSAAQGNECAQAALETLDRTVEALEAIDAEAKRAKQQADADAMMEQLLAEDVEEKKAEGAAQSAKSAKGKKTKKKRGGPAAANVAGGHAPEARGAGVEAAVGEAQADLVPVAPTDPAAVALQVVPPLIEAGMTAAPVPVPVASGASGWGRGGRGLGGRGLGGRGLGGRGLGGRGDQRVQSATTIATGGDAVGAVSHLPGQLSVQVPAGSSDDGAAAPASAAAVVALDIPVGATARGRSGRGLGGRGLGGRGLGGRGLGGRGDQLVQSAAAIVTGDDTVRDVAHLLGQASLQTPAGSSNAGAAAPVAEAAPVALDMPSLPPAAVTSLADAHFNTGRPEAPESTIGGQTTCIVCFVNPKSHAAVPCGHWCACGDCSARMQECPVCRSPAREWMHVRVA